MTDDTVTLTLEILEETREGVLASDCEQIVMLPRADIRIAPLPRMAHITMPRALARKAGWIE